MTRSLFAALTLTLLSWGAVSSAAHAQPSATVVMHSNAPHYQVHRAPPPPRHEAIPAARRGMQWVPGHWSVSGKKHAWQRGHWVKARAGYHYRAPTWVQHGNRWEMRQGGWQSAHGHRAPRGPRHAPHGDYRR